jgi:putative ABC transport system permease protein
MFNYYASLAVRSFRRNPVLSALMVIAIGLGIGTSITTLTMLHLLSGNPIPGKSAVLYYPQVDARTADGGKSAGGEPMDQMAYPDAMNLLTARRADRQAVMVAGEALIRPDSNVKAFYVGARYTSADFFTMFSLPFLQGGGWSAAEDEAKAQVVVIAKTLNDKLFPGGQSVGKILRIGKNDFRVIGVLDDWRPVPYFFDLKSQSAYARGAEVYIPFSTSRDLKFGINGSIDCWGKNFDASNLEVAPCAWLQFWVELDSPAKAAAYKEFLVHYSEEQKTLGRYERAPNVRLRGLMDWLDYKKVVPGDVRLQAWLSFGFLVVCMVNTIGLLLAKFLRRAPEIGVRRALGASRRDIFAQFLMEAAAIGVGGGLLGLLLALGGLWAVRQQPAAYADLAHLDAPMFLSTFALAVLASLLAGLLPAWRACGVPPALQLKAN